MAADETKANLERVLATLTAGEQDQPAAPARDCAGPASAEPSDALQHNPVALLYQAKIDIKQRCLAGAEALMRTHDDASGSPMPVDASGQGADDEMGRLIGQVLVTMLRDGAIFDEAGFNLRLSINVPIHLLERLPIADIVAEHRPKTESWPGLIVEVAEDQIARDINRSVAIAEKLRGSGIAIAIDDFGAGYSSFASLRELAFAELKLNSSFVRGCAGDPTNAAICQTAIDLAHRFGSAAVAEGIETVADLQAMQIMGCDLAQGALIAPALARDDFLALLRQRMNKRRPPRPARPAEEPPAAASA